METLLFFALGLSLLSILLLNKNQLAFAGLFSGGEDENSASLAERMKSFILKIDLVKEGDDDTCEPPPPPSPDVYPNDFREGGIYCDDNPDHRDKEKTAFMGKNTNLLVNISGNSSSKDYAPIDIENARFINIWKQGINPARNYNGELTFVIKSELVKVEVVDGIILRNDLSEDNFRLLTGQTISA